MPKLMNRDLIYDIDKINKLRLGEEKTTNSS